MFSTPKHTHNSIRFKRWSRNDYAIFSSLNKVVTIGKVSAQICEKSLQKNNEICSFVNLTQLSCDEQEKVYDDAKSNIQLNDLLFIPIQPTYISTKQQQTYNNIYYYVSPKRLNNHFS